MTLEVHPSDIFSMIFRCSQLAYLQSKGHWTTKQTLEVIDTKPALNIYLAPPALEDNPKVVIADEGSVMRT